jgi:hypothetical protein
MDMLPAMSAGFLLFSDDFSGFLQPWKGAVLSLFPPLFPAVPGFRERPPQARFADRLPLVPLFKPAGLG